VNKGHLFLEELSEHVIIGDGAYGTEFIARGCHLEGGLERLNLYKPDFVENLHREYIAAGSRLIETNTFQANRINLAKFGADRTTGK
jgi:methionine synthase / methylenetetrahydrofolate reductase(NADPH)